MAEPFDKASLLDRIDNDAEFLAETVEMLEEDGPPLLDDMRQAAARGDSEQLARAAHAFKGMASNFCAEPAQAAARRVETLGRGGDLGGAGAAVADLLDEADRLRQALKQLVESMRV